MFKQPLKKISLRFRRWSHKSFAVFKTIGIEVNIGSLKAIISDALLGKQKNAAPVSANTGTFSKIEKAYSENEEITAESFLKPAAAFAFSLTKSEPAKIYFKELQLWPNADQTAFGHFY